MGSPDESEYQMLEHSNAEQSHYKHIDNMTDNSSLGVMKKSSSTILPSQAVGRLI